VLVRTLALYRAGQLDDAADLFYRFLPLMRFEFQDGIGLAIRKELYRRRGALSDASTRAPGPVLDEGTRAQLDRVLAWTAAQPGSASIFGA
jgi:4-hydroxy-tetrahydrodipicolinate synthase